MNTNRIRNMIALALLCVLLTSQASAQSFTTEEIADTLKQFRTYDYPGDPTPTNRIENIVRFVGDKPQLRAAAEEQMIALLESDATVRAKQFVCHQLWIIATDKSNLGEDALGQRHRRGGLLCPSHPSGRRCIASLARSPRPCGRSDKDSHPQYSWR